MTFKKTVGVSISIFIMICMLVVSCSKKTEQGNDSISKNDVVTYDLGEDPDTSRLEKFVNNVESDKKDKVSLVSRTIEGDPITTQLNFDGKEIEIATDISKDRFGGPDKEKVIYETIKGDNKLKENLLKYLNDHNFLKLK